MQLLEAGVETSVIALWLGHEHIQTTQIYLHGDLRLGRRKLIPAIAIQAVIDASLDEFELEVRRGR